MKKLLLLPLLLALSACPLNPTTPDTPSTGLQTFDQYYAAGVQADDLAVVTTTNVLKSGLITSAQAQKVQDITVKAKSVLDAAQAAYTAGNSIAANANLAQATTTLVGLSLCLTIKPLTVATFDSCIQPILTPVVTP